MLNSMTGFARALAETAFGTMTCELRAVNHRFLDVQIRLPDELRARENDLRSVIGEAIKRGKIECSLHLRRGGTKGGEITLNAPLVRQIAAKAREISELMPDSRPPDPMDLLRWPGVVAETGIESEPLYAEAVLLVEKALASLTAMRASEGGRIAAMLDTRLDEITRIAATVRARMPEVLEATRVRMMDRVARLAVEADPGRLETELALIAQKLDVDEELDRLESHVSEVRSALASSEPVGRRVDFLMQELNREANTLGSKSADTETTAAAIDLKVLVEQMREQVQNVE